MQPEKYTFLDYARRTDALAAFYSINLEGMPEKLGISRASFFAYRKGKNPISSKAWMKLEQVERMAGVSPPLQDQIIEAQKKGKDEAERVASSGSLVEIFSLLPEKHRQELFAMTGEKLAIEMEIFFKGAEALASLTKKILKDPGNKEVAEDAEYFAEEVGKSVPTAREIWKTFKNGLDDFARIARQ